MRWPWQVEKRMTLAEVISEMSRDIRTPLVLKEFEYYIDEIKEGVQQGWKGIHFKQMPKQREEVFGLLRKEGFKVTVCHFYAPDGYYMENGFDIDWNQKKIV